MRTIEMASPEKLVARIEVSDPDSYNGVREIGKLIVDDQDDLDYFRKIRDKVED